MSLAESTGKFPLQWTQRPATELDKEFIQETDTLCYREVVERQFGAWDGSKFNFKWDPQRYQVIILKSEDQKEPDSETRVGMLALTDDGNVRRESSSSITTTRRSIFLEEISIHPSFQGKGLGSSVIKSLMKKTTSTPGRTTEEEEEVKEAPSPPTVIKLQVLRENKRALSLYLRLGFNVTQKTESHIHMEWTQQQTGAPPLQTVPGCQPSTSLPPSSSSSFDDFEDVTVEELERERAKEQEQLPWLQPGHPLHYPTPNEDPVKLKALQEMTAVESWCSLLGDELTFPTRVIPLTLQEVEAILSQKEEAGDGKSGSNANSASDCISGLTTKIDTALKSEVFRGRAFLRLDTKSPKDAAFLTEPFRSRTIEKLLQNPLFRGSAHGTEQPTSTTTEDRLISDQNLLALTQASLQALCISSGAEAIKLLQGSPRCFADLATAVASSTTFSEEIKEDKYKDKGGVGGNPVISSIILRKWFPSLDPASEMRLFVSRLVMSQEGGAPKEDEKRKESKPAVVNVERGRGGAKLTAFCPYFHYLNFENLGHSVDSRLQYYESNNVEILKKALVRFVEQVVEVKFHEAKEEAHIFPGNTGKRNGEEVPSLKNESYSLDICLIPVETLLFKADQETDGKAIDSDDQDDHLHVTLSFASHRPLSSTTGAEADGSVVKRKFRIWVVELNGFFPSVTGPMSFDWRKDFNLLCCGSSDDDQVEFRQATESKSSIDGISLLPGALAVLKEAESAK